MPAIVAHPDISSHPVPSPLNPCWHYGGRSPNAVQAVTVHPESDHKLSTRKCTSVALFNASSKGPSSKTPVALERDVAGGKLAELVPATHATGRLSDNANHKLPHDDPKDNLEDAEGVLGYLAIATPGSRKEFPGVGAREFYSIQRTVGETEEILRKPRLTYNYIAHHLTIDMPSTLHEEPFDYLKECFTIAIAALPYDRDVIRPRIHMNYELQLQDQLVMPDMTVTLTSVEGPTEVVSIGVLGECALSENKNHVFDKMEAEIKAHPEAAMAVIVLMEEALKYASPQEDSTVSPALRNGNEDEPLPLALRTFIGQRSTPRSFAHPVTVGDHRWCQVRSVEYFVWVKGEDGRPIDVRKHEPGRAAYGLLVPETDMQEVTDLLGVGLSRVRDAMVDLSKEISPGLDCSELEEAEVTLPIRWPLAIKGLLSAVDVTAHQRYQTWHVGTFRGTKRNRDSTYCPSETDSDSEESQESGAPSRTSKRLRA